MQTAPVELSAFVSHLLARCLSIRSVWTLGPGEFLVFADPAALRSLRKCDELHRADVEVLVVVDGDSFENAWGGRKLSGSLARWAWRQVSPELAYFDESRWKEGDAGGVVRVRRKASLLWPSQAVH